MLKKNNIVRVISNVCEESFRKRIGTLEVVDKSRKAYQYGVSFPDRVLPVYFSEKELAKV